MKEDTLSDIARLAMQGKGAVLQEHIEGLGLEDRLSFLRKVAEKTREIRQTDKSWPALRVVVDWVQEDDVVADSRQSHHIQIRLCQEVIKLFAGDCIYQERFYLFDPSLRREVKYFDNSAFLEKKRKVEAAPEQQLEENNLNMCMRVIESLARRHDLADAEAVLSRLEDLDWIEGEGYGHIAHVLNGPTGLEACKRIFAGEVAGEKKR